MHSLSVIIIIHSVVSFYDRRADRPITFLSCGHGQLLSHGAGMHLLVVISSRSAPQGLLLVFTTL